MANYLLPLLAAVLLLGTGTALQKHGIAKSVPQLTPKRVFSEFRSVLGALLRSRAWLLGRAATATGNLLVLESIARGEISVVFPILSVSLVVSSAIGVLWLGERIVRRETLGVFLMIGGAAWLSVGAREPAS